MLGLRAVGVRDMSGLRVLDVGCGGGVELVRFIARGAQPANCFGIDLDASRVAQASALHPSLNLVVGNVADLPWPDGTFDIVSQFTTFTSILAASERERAAQAIQRALRPGGILIWYDFWVNPTNKNTRPISAAGVRELFPGFVGPIRRLTLVPPLARRIAPRSLLLASLLQELGPLQTHLLGVLRKSA